MRVINFKSKKDMFDNLGKIDISGENVYFDNDGDWYGLEINDEIVSVALIRHMKNGTYGLNSLYTDPEQRANGYMRCLLVDVLSRYEVIIKTHAQRSSHQLLVDLGFKTIRIGEFKGDVQFIMYRYGGVNNADKQ